MSNLFDNEDFVMTNMTTVEMKEEKTQIYN